MRAPVGQVVIEGNCARAVRVRNETRSFDAVAVTLPIPAYRRLILDALGSYLAALWGLRYLGLIWALVALDRPLSEYRTLDIADEGIPFSSIEETTTYINPLYVGGYHLVYLAKYAAQESEWYRRSKGEIRELWLYTLETLFPNYDRRSIRHFHIEREPFVEPLHGLNEAQPIPGVETPVENLYLVTAAQVFPQLATAEAVTRHARVRRLIVSTISRAVNIIGKLLPLSLLCEGNVAATDRHCFPSLHRM